MRGDVVAQGSATWSAYIPPAGMTGQQFGEMAAALSKEKFSQEELKCIVRALSLEVDADDLITREEFEAWCEGGSRLML